ncbi:MAG: PAS domain-containing protein [Arcobacter sp.]|uniref:PAS sensor-containing MCP-domain signal transduction protein n=1 Tax=Arcobacter defluvii TaxID=873191 RepID=A0AAE7BE02_9BACT|nr:MULTISPECIES: PAS domain-containing methyl-accepting chemotaxis protein [Arcobacter]QKF76788.1 PAS sensor-containing MCP-domain signal transduction protein [Arcobacter defluvii]RXI34929.1 methyl-accepting chemotaxis protein [Arcobacter defluvii]BAK72603.1 methyl-accepting chemotaxis protein [Arcobacter sp. L]
MFFSFSKNKEEKSQLDAINENFAVISFKPDGTILDANKNFLEAMGYTKDEIIGKDHKMFCNPKYSASQAYKDFWENLNKGKVQTSEFRRIKKNKEPIYLQASYTPIKDSNGHIYKVIKFAQDITERKIQALDYSGQIKAISKSQAVIEFNLDGTIITANENFLNALGYKLDEIVGKHHSIFCEETYKNSSEYKDFWKKLNNGEYEAGEFLRIGKNGKKVWIQATYTPIMNMDGEPFKVVKYATDITHKKNIMFEIGENIQKLTKSLNNLSTASNTMSKEAKVTMDGSQEVSVSLEQMNQAVSDLSEKIESMLASINTIALEATNGEEISKGVKEQSKTTSAAMIKLNEEASKISQTISIITQIAFQTNILSLNAAVEAATAGEAGKGFAVVAAEVRNLATRSNEAAKEITTAVEYIQSLIKNSLDSIHMIDSTIEEMSSISSKISNSMSEQQTISNALASSALETSQGINEISHTMINVSQSAKTTEDEAIETVNASKELIDISKTLISTIKSLN